MRGIDAVKDAIGRSGHTYVDVADALGYEGDYPTQFVSKKFVARKNMDIDDAAQILAAVGYKLVIMPAGSKTPKGGTEIR